jgi:uncharacterized protein
MKGYSKGETMDIVNVIYKELADAAAAVTGVVSTHSHYLRQDIDTGETLHQLMQKTYISWGYPAFPDTAQERKRYVRTVGTNSYYTWMARSLGYLYGNGEPLTADNWDRIDAAFRRANQVPGHSLSILKDVCRYGAIVLDKYDDPGSDVGLPALMKPTFRCDPFLHGYAIDGHDANNNFPYRMLGLDRMPERMEDYIQAVDERIGVMRSQGCVALKIAIAYERDLAFDPLSDEAARQAYHAPTPSPEQVRAFGDAMMFALCRIAAKYDMPIQIHTGLGKLEGSNAMGLKKLIEQNPQTKFSLFHCGYPWMDDVLGLLHNYRNVYPDLCWLPLISTSAAIRFIREALEVGDATRLTWGCDTWTAQESYGALLAIRHCLASSLASLCEEDLMTIDQAKTVIRSILKTNAETLYGIAGSGS